MEQTGSVADGAGQGTHDPCVTTLSVVNATRELMASNTPVLPACVPFPGRCWVVWVLVHVFADPQLTKDRLQDPTQHSGKS